MPCWAKYSRTHLELCLNWVCEHKNRHPQMALCGENVNYSTKGDSLILQKKSPDYFHMAPLPLDWFWLLKLFGLLTSIRMFYNRKSTNLSCKKVIQIIHLLCLKLNVGVTAFPVNLANVKWIPVLARVDC